MSIRISRVIHSFFYKTKFWPPLIALWIITLIAGYIGFKQSSFSGDFFDQSYSTIKLAVGGYPAGPIEEPLLLNFARFFAFFLAFATFLVAIETLFYEETRRWWYVHRGGHTIICGVGSIGKQYIRRYLDADDHPFIVIESNPLNPQIKSLQEEGVLILTGDATIPYILEKAGIHTAKNLLAVTGSDTKNAVIANTCEAMRAGNPDEFICNVHIVNPLLCNLLQAKWFRKRLSNSTNEKNETNNLVKVEPFNIYQLAGMLILDEFPPFKRINNPDDSPNILIIGGGKLGEAIMQRLPHIWQITPGIKPGSRYNVTLIDRKATALTKSYLHLYPIIQKYCDIIPMDLEIGSAEFLSLSFFFNKSTQCPFNIIYICLYDYENGLYTALEIDELLHTLNEHERPEIILRTRYADGMNQFARDTIVDHKNQPTIKMFPLIDRVCSPEFTENGMFIEVLAHATHENYIKTCIDKGETIRERPRMVPFNDLPDEYKRSNRDQALKYSAVLSLFGYGISYKSRWDTGESAIFLEEEIEQMAEIEHDRWWDEKKALTKPEDRSFKPFRELSPDDQDYDRNVFRNLNNILARVNMKVVKKGGLSGTRNTQSEGAVCEWKDVHGDHVTR